MATIVNVSGDYPNLSYENLVGCAREINENHATELFHQCCPDLYTVEKVMYFPSRRRPYCRWLVQYSLKDRSNSPEPAKELKSFQKKIKLQPLDVRILTKRYEEPDKIIITYAVKCDCETSLDFILDLSQRSDIYTIKEEAFPDLQDFFAFLDTSL